MTVERHTDQQRTTQQLDVIIDLQRRQLDQAARSHRFLLWVFWLYLGIPTLIVLLLYARLSAPMDAGIIDEPTMTNPVSGPPTVVVVLLVIGGITLAGALIWLLIERVHQGRSDNSHR